MNGDRHPWASALEEFEQETLPLLKQIGHAMGKRSEVDDDLGRTCQKAIRYYAMLTRSFDPMFFELLKTEIRNYQTQTQTGETP